MKRLIFCSLIVVVLFFIFLSSLNSQQADALANFTIRFIDVGQGDAAWLQTPDGLDILIDGGRYGQALQYLQDFGSPDIETMVASHPDADHMGGLVRILEALPVYQVMRDGQDNDTQVYRSFVNLIALKGIPDRLTRWPDSHTWGCCITAQVLNPVDPFAFSNRNENSVVLKVTHGTVDILFTGDAGTPAEGDILARASEVHAEILKVSHHGSNTGSSNQFLTAVQPETAVISVGANNPYGHPSPEVLERLANAGASIYRTDELGTIVVTSNGSTYSVSVTPSATQTAYIPLIMKNYPLPDLIPLSMKIELETGEACTSTPGGLGLRVWFENTGDAPAGPFVVEANGLQMTVESGLAAGATKALWFEHYWRAGENTAIVDATNLVQESNEDNNELTQMVPIPTLPPTCTPTASPSPSVTATSTNTPDQTPTATSTFTPTGTSTPTRAPTIEPTLTPTPTYTATPTPTATSTSAPSDVQVNGFCSQFDAPGNDHENLNGEWVCFTNHGGGPAEMTNWRVEDEADHTYRFPSFTLPAGATVKLHTGSGTNSATDLYWGSGRAIWNNSGDTVSLYDAGGNLVDEYSY